MAGGLALLAVAAAILKGALPVLWQLHRTYLVLREYWRLFKRWSDGLRREQDLLEAKALAYRRNPYRGLIAYHRARARRFQAELDELYRRAEARPHWPISRRSPRRKPIQPVTSGPGSAAPP